MVGFLWCQAPVSLLSNEQQTVRDVAKFTTITAGAQGTVRNHLEYDSFGNVTSADDPTTGTANNGDLPGLEGVGNEHPEFCHDEDRV